MVKQILFWVLAFLITIGAAVYQRTTGPTYPKKGEVTFEGNKIVYKFNRSDEVGTNHSVKIEVTDQNVTGILVYKRYKSNDTLTRVPMRREGNMLLAEFPSQPPAGKVQYYVELAKGATLNIPEEPIVLRFKGAVPMWILIPHILIIFMAMMFSNRAGLEACREEPKTKNLVLWTIILFALGGFLLGPIVQKYAFGAYWTGFPFGTDLTDNKTLIGGLAWIAALIMTRKGKPARLWVIGAAIIMLLVYLIPHSLLGSEIDYTKTEQKVEAPVK